MNLRKMRQKEKKRHALNEERMAGKIFNHSDPTANSALHCLKNNYKDISISKCFKKEKIKVYQGGLCTPK